MTRHTMVNGNVSLLLAPVLESPASPECGHVWTDGACETCGRPYTARVHTQLCTVRAEIALMAAWQAEREQRAAHARAAADLLPASVVAPF